jgi:hypothetical protein
MLDPLDKQVSQVSFVPAPFPASILLDPLDKQVSQVSFVPTQVPASSWTR